MNLEMQATVYRKNKIAFEGHTNTSKIKRGLQELLKYTIRDNPVPPCTPAVLTGTGIVPPMDFTLKEGDLVELEIEKIGELRNPVIKL